MQERKEDNSSKSQNNSQQIVSKQQISLLCPVCDDFIVKAVVTNCGHTFCEHCLNEYMLFLDECPQCYQPVRHQKINFNILLDSFIKDYIKKQQLQSLQAYQTRIEQSKEFNLKKKVKSVSAGDKLDIRDVDYVWCSGQVTRTLNKWQERTVKYIVIKYDHNGRKEELLENSPRLATYGFYTSRTDIPRYTKGTLVYQTDNIFKKVPIGQDEEQKSNPND